MASYIVNNSTYGGLKMYNLSLSLKRMQQAYTRLKRMLVDNESLTAYLVPLVDPMTSPLYGFTSDNTIPQGKITLAVEVVAPPQVSHHFMESLIVDNKSTYHWVPRYNHTEGIVG